MCYVPPDVAAKATAARDHALTDRDLAPPAAGPPSGEGGLAQEEGGPALATEDEAALIAGKDLTLVGAHILGSHDPPEG